MGGIPTSFFLKTWAIKKLCPVGAAAATSRAAGRMSEVKKHMIGENVANMMDNQVRDVHHWAATNLGQINQVSNGLCASKIN